MNRYSYAIIVRDPILFRGTDVIQTGRTFSTRLHARIEAQRHISDYLSFCIYKNEIEITINIFATWKTPYHIK